jgi:DNA-binding MurR/RpiR family transcriptional regulator
MSSGFYYKGQICRFCTRHEDKQAVSSEASAQPGYDLDRLLQQANQQLGVAGLRVVRFINENRQIVLASSAAALGDRTGTSDATVVRTVQALGFAGLGDLKRAILNSIGQVATPADDMRRTLRDLEKSTGHAIDSVLNAHEDGLSVLRSDECRAQIAAGVRAVDASSRIVVFGIGPSAALANYVSVLLARCGRRNRTLDATGSMLADQLLDLREGDCLLILAYGRLYKEVTAVFAEAKRLGLATVLVTEAYDTQLARMADVVIAIPRGRPGQVSLHGATLVGLEALVLSLAAAKPDDALTSLDKLNHLRRAIDAPRKVRG